MNMNRRGLFGVLAAAVAGLAWRPVKAARRWVNVDRRVDGLVERGRYFLFSGEAFDQREPILREIEAYLLQVAEATRGHNVWRVGRVEISLRSGVGGEDMANVEDGGQRPLVVTWRDHVSEPASGTAALRAGASIRVTCLDGQPMDLNGAVYLKLAEGNDA